MECCVCNILLYSTIIVHKALNPDGGKGRVRVCWCWHVPNEITTIAVVDLALLMRHVAFIFERVTPPTHAHMANQSTWIV